LVVDLKHKSIFVEEYWADPTTSKAFLARIFVEHCISTKDVSRQESALPVVTFLAFKIQSAYNALLGRIQELSEIRQQTAQNEDEDEEIDEKQEEMEFLIGEMLKLAVHLDYADEIGRRKMFGLVRESSDLLCDPLS
jgi:condensin complex subunit 3